MPAVIAIAASYAGVAALEMGLGTGIAMAVANTVGFLMTYVVPTVLISTISRAVAKRPSVPSLRSLGNEVNVRDPAAPRQIIYGARRVSGIFYPVGTSGTKNEYLHVLLLVAGHEVEDLGKIYFADEEIPLDVSGNATGRFAGYVRVKKHTGTYNQTVDTDLQSDLGSVTWTNNHRLQGIAYLYLRFKHNPDLFAGIPEIYCDVKGRKVYDPRDGTQNASTYSTWKWSDNAALCLADWVRGVPTLNASGTIVRNYGIGAKDDELDYTALITAANICDETVVTDTGTEKRYTCNGVIVTNTRAGDGIDVMKSAMAGDCVYVGGLWLILAGAYRTPTVTLTQSDLRGALSGVRFKPSRKDICNMVKGVYVSVNNANQPTDFPPVKNATYRTQDGDEDLAFDIELPFTNSNATAQRLAKITMERSRQGISFVARCKLTAMQVQVGDVVQFTYARFGWSTKPFEVVGFAFVPERDATGNTYLGVDLTLRETVSAVWDWNNGEETNVDPAPNTNLPNPFSVPTPSTPTLSSGSGVATQQSDGTILNRLKVAWTAPSNEYVTNGGVIWIEYKKNADTDWITWSNSVRGDQTVDYILDVKVGTAYDVRLRFENSLGVRGSYSSTATHTVVAAPVIPSNPTAATLSSSGFYSATDGTVMSYLTFSVPALPSNAAKQFVMYKRSTDTDWLVAAGPLTNTGALTVTINDLTPGTIYAVATVAFSSLDVTSSYVTATSSPFTAPSKNTGATAPSSVLAAKDGVVPNYVPNTAALRFGSRVTWTPSTDADFAYYEIKATATDSDGAIDYTWDDGRGSTGVYRTADSWFLLYITNLTVGYVRVRAVNKSGVASSWTRFGNINSSSYATLAAGNMSSQNSTDVSTTGIKTGGGSSTRQINVVFSDSIVVSLTGGALTENVNVSLTNRGFSAKPDSGWAQCSNDANIVAAYDFDAAGNSSTNAVIRVTTLDGTNLPSGLHRFSVEFTDYT